MFMFDTRVLTREKGTVMISAIQPGWYVWSLTPDGPAWVEVLHVHKDQKDAGLVAIDVNARQRLWCSRYQPFITDYLVCFQDHKKSITSRITTVKTGDIIQKNACALNKNDSILSTVAKETIYVSGDHEIDPTWGSDGKIITTPFISISDSTTTNDLWTIETDFKNYAVAVEIDSRPSCKQWIYRALFVAS